MNIHDILIFLDGNVAIVAPASFLIGIVAYRVFGDFHLSAIRLPLLSFSKAETEKTSGHSEVIEGNVVNDLHEFNPRKIVRKYFPSYDNFSVVQYGSSIRGNGANFRDIDFLILLIGSPSDKERIILHEGHTPIPGVHNKQSIDIVFRDYNSFLFALVAGMPYEHSVIRWCRVRKGHVGYIKWLQRLAKNILVDRDYLIRRLDERISRQKYIFSKLDEKTDIYDICREGYFLVSYAIQKRWAEQQKKVLRHNELADIALSANMKAFLEDNESREKYLKLISYVKRESMPVNTIEAIELVDDLLINNG